MKIRNVIANMCLKGKEERIDIEELHNGFGCLHVFGFHEDTCEGLCKPCFDRKLEVIINPKYKSESMIKNYAYVSEARKKG